MQHKSNQIIREYWRSFLLKNDQYTFEAWNTIFSSSTDEKFELVFEIEDFLISRINEMTKNSPFLIHNFVTIITANSIRRYNPNALIPLVSPALSNGDQKGLDNTMIGFWINVDSNLSFKEQFVDSKQLLAKATEMAISDSELIENNANLRIGIRVEGYNYQWDQAVLPKITIDWCLEEKRLKILGRKDTHDESILAIFGANILTALKSCIESPYEKIIALGLQSEEEKNFLSKVEKSNAPIEVENWIIPVFEALVVEFPDAIAVAHNDTTLTYRELNEKSNQLARFLAQECSVGSGHLVGIMLERSPKLMTSVLALWKLGAAYIPIETGYPEKRIEDIVNNAQLELIITNSLTQKITEKLGIKSVNIEEVKSDAFDTANLNIAVSKSDLAYVIYTSGSTGKPKGVMIEHDGMLNHMEGKIKDLKINSSTRLAQNAPFGFDISIWQLFAALLTGGTTVIYDNDLVYDCDAFVDRINQDGITLLELVPSYLTEILSNLEGKEVGSYYKKLDRVVLNAEPLLPWMVNKWLDLFPNIPIYNTYGATEVSDDISHFIIEEKVAFRTVPVLKGTINNAQINLVDENFYPVPPGAIGEIILSGNSVGKGYLNDEIRTKAAFLDGPIKNVTSETKVYKTGDLGRFLGDGSLEFIGRVDKQVKINGQRVELGAVEHVLASFDEVTNAVVLPNASNSELIAFYTGAELSKEHFQNALFDHLPHYMIPKVFVYLDAFPLSSNGKIERSKLPVEKYSQGTSRREYVAPETPIQKELATMWEEILNKERVGLLDDFFEIGGHSLKIMNLFGKIRKKYQVNIELRDLFNNTNLASQAKLIENAEYGSFELIEKIPEADKYVLSSAQTRLWILSQDPEINAAYNMPMVVNFGDSLNIQHLIVSVKHVIEQHESLRTTFVKEEDGSVWQKVNAPDANFTIPVIDCQDLKDDEITEIIHEKSTVQFDLEKGPLFTFELYRRSQGDYIFFTNVHHIISDGWSEVILIKKITENYERLSDGKEIINDELSIQYKDYAAWQINELNLEGSQKQLDYWLEQFAGEIPIIDFPSQKTRPKDGAHNGRSVRSFIPNKDINALKEFTLLNDGSLFAGLMTIWKVLTYIYTKQNDLIIGTPVAGREHEQLTNQIGFYVNVLAIRSLLDSQQSFTEFFNQVKKQIIEAYSRQSYPFDQIVEKLNLKRDISRNPLFDIIINFQNREDAFSIVESTDFSEEIVDTGMRTARMDIELGLQENEHGLMVDFTYNSNVYNQELIVGLLGHFKYLIANIAQYSESPIASIDLVHGEEREMILNGFNDTKQDFPSDDSIVSLFEKQAKKTPENKAIVYGDVSLTYRELNQRSNQFARYLIEKHGVQPQERIGIQVDRDEWMMVVYLGTLKARAIQVPLDTVLPVQRIKHIEKDSRWKLCINEKDVEEFASCYQDYSDQNLELGVFVDDVTYIIYTSGSTGLPKGVEVTNCGLVNFISWCIRRYNFTESDRFVKHMNMSFDASVIEVYPTLLSGAALYMAPSHFLLNTGKLNPYLESNAITIFLLPPALHDQFYTFNNKSLRLLISGGSQLKTYQDQGFEVDNMYGPTEGTVACLAHWVTENSQNIPIGKPVQNVAVYILDENDRICPVGVPGQIHISGVGLAKGYLNQEVLTNEKFVFLPHITESRLYKTGDLGRWLPDGNVEFNGRLDDQVKIRGYRIELGEISNVLTEHPYIESAESIIVENEKGEKEIASYIVASVTLKIGDLRNFLKAYLPDYMLPTYFVHLDSFPLTQNGKINKDELPSPYSSHKYEGYEYTEPSNDLEMKLAELWGEILHRDKIGVNDNFFEIGGHSLKLTALQTRIKTILEVDISFKNLFAATTISEQAQLISDSDTIQRDQILPLAEAEMYVASTSQKRLWFLSQISGVNAAYNIPGVRKFKGQLNPEILSEALDYVVLRHEILRTVFKYTNGEVYQVIKQPDEIGFKLNILDFTSKSKKELDAYSQDIIESIFDVENGPLLRSDLLQVSKDEYLFFFNLHHIITDGWSMGVLEKEIIAYYNARITDQLLNLPELRIQYKDYAAWEALKLEQPRYLEEKQFWLDTFQGDIPVLNLPTSFLRPTKKTFNGAMESRILDQSNFINLKAMMAERGATLFMGLLGVLNVLLYKYSGQTKQIIGTPLAGRNNIDLENQIGFYANTLALLSDFSEQDRFIDLLDQIKQRTSGAFSNQMYPFDHLVDQLNLKRDISRSPLFDFMISLQNTEVGQRDVVTMHGLEIHDIDPGDAATSKYDMTFHFSELNDNLIFNLEYNTDIYEKSAVNRLMEQFDILLGSVVHNQFETLSNLNYLSQEEQVHLVHALNTDDQLAKDTTLIELFEEQVVLNKDGIALVYKDKQYTYGELNKVSNQLARFLMDQLEVPEEGRVALLMERNDRAVIGILAILKTGATYIPIDLSMPDDRRNFMIEDASCDVVLDEALFDQFNDKSEDYPEENMQIAYSDSSNAYMIYTSGMTDFPMGVPIKNRAIVNTVCWKIQAGSFDRTSVGLHFVSSSFDVSIEDLFSLFLAGGTMVLLEDEKNMQFDQVYKQIVEHQVNTFACTQTVFTQLYTDYPDILNNIRTLTMREGAINSGWINELLDKFPALTILFEYGLTEAAFTSSALILNAESRFDTNINSIGRPIPNHQLFILDANLRLVTKGVVGQICISGIGLTEGYWNQPELNSTKFVDHPFIKGEKLFLTGDTGCYLEDTQILLIGRMDDQVKIQGNRIELGEIENALRLNEQISDVFVTTFEENGREELVVYYSSDTKLAVGDVLAFMKTKIPAYMIPLVLINLEKLPVTINGKVDKTKLPVPTSNKIRINKEFIDPENETEAQLEKIWCEILSVAKVSTHDNFFEVGGNSMKTMQLCNRVNEVFNREDEVILFFENPTIKSYAAYIDGYKKENQLSDETLDEAADSLSDTLAVMNLMGQDED